MKFKTSIISLFFVFVLLISSVSAITSEGFESGWGSWVSGGVPVRSENAPRSGSFSLYDGHGGSGSVDQDYVYVSWDLTDTSNYATCSFWMRCLYSSATDFRPMYRLRFVNGTTWLDWTSLTVNQTNIFVNFEHWTIVLPSTYYGYTVYMDLTANYTYGTDYYGMFTLDDIQLDYDSSATADSYLSAFTLAIMAFIVVLFPAFIVAMAFREQKLSPITGFLIGITLGLIMGVIAGIVPSYALLSLCLVIVYLIIKGR